jgi:hypothetical protein
MLSLFLTLSYVHMKMAIQIDKCRDVICEIHWRNHYIYVCVCEFQTLELGSCTFGLLTLITIESTDQVS